MVAMQGVGLPPDGRCVQNDGQAIARIVQHLEHKGLWRTMLHSLEVRCFSLVPALQRHGCKPACMLSVAPAGLKLSKRPC